MAVQIWSYSEDSFQSGQMLFSPPSCLTADTVHTESTAPPQHLLGSGHFLLMSHRCLAATWAYEGQRRSKIDPVGSEGSMRLKG